MQKTPPTVVVDGVSETVVDCYYSSSERIRVQGSRADDPLSNARRLDAVLGLGRKQCRDALWIAFTCKHGDPLGSA